jgi:hypothetical protein
VNATQSSQAGVSGDNESAILIGLLVTYVA